MDGMSINWKPGNMAVTQFGLAVVDSGNRCDHHDSRPHWHHIAGGWDPLGAHSSARPLVVIDPEDREQVERLLSYYVAPFEDFVTDGRMDHMQAALREFANPTPPKPEEPTGLGAVVEDADGNRWVLYTHPDNTAPWCDGSASCEWDEIAVVRVLSEGVRDV